MKAKTVAKSGSFTIVNKRGLHARAAAKLVKLAGTFPCQLRLSARGEPMVSGKSIMGVLLLCGGLGTVIHVQAEGERAEDAVAGRIHRWGELLVVDGIRGEVIVDPTPEQLALARRRAQRYRSMALKLNAARDTPARSLDAVDITLLANVEIPAEARLAVEHGAQGVGLYRTELLYVNRSVPPSEEEQLGIFREVIASMGKRSVTLRTFDIGGDKSATAFRLPRELNPMLGLRAVRLALSEREVFLTHLRAMLRASADGDVRIMLPLVTTIDEFEQVRLLLEQAKAQLRSRGQAFREEVPLGVMIEVPAAAVQAELFARRASFMSIGSNDLVQYALAIDRTSQALAKLASPFEPGVLRLIQMVIHAGQRAGCPVSLCGEMASEPVGALLLLGLGLRTLSMESVAIPEIKEAVRRIHMTELEELAKRSLEQTGAAQVEQLWHDQLGARIHDLLTGQEEDAPSEEHGRLS